MMRMALMVDVNYGKASTTDLSDIESPEYVGRQMKQNYVLDGAEQIRVQMHGKFLRGYELDPSFVNKVLVKKALEALDSAERSRDPEGLLQRVWGVRLPRQMRYAQNSGGKRRS